MVLRNALGGGNLLTVPNALCAIRLAGSPVVLALAWGQFPRACLGLALALLATDWLDGRLARLLKQQTTFGARLDSLADATFYTCLLASLAYLRQDLVRREALWIGLALAGYLVNIAAGWARFGCVPCYHTWMAKTSWLLMTLAVLSLLLEGPVLAARVALLAVLITNLEETAITFLLARWRPDVPSLFHALRDRSGRGGHHPC